MTAYICAIHTSASVQEGGSFFNTNKNKKSFYTKPGTDISKTLNPRRRHEMIKCCPRYTYSLTALSGESYKQGVVKRIRTLSLGLRNTPSPLCHTRQEASLRTSVGPGAASAGGGARSSKSCVSDLGVRGGVGSWWLGGGEYSCFICRSC